MAIYDFNGKETVSVESKELRSKDNFDRVREVQIKMPETVISGDLSKSEDFRRKSQVYRNNDNPNISDPPNFRKEIGVSVSEEGFIKLPRSLLKSEVWKSLRLRQQKLFLYILEKAQFNHYIFKYNGKDIALKPGDLCNSYRGLAEDFNQTVKFRDEKIDASFVQRAVSAFSKHGLTDTRTDTGILVISIIYPGIYDNIKSTPDTQDDTDAIQARYTNEEREEREDREETIERADAPDSSLLNLEKEKKQKSPSVFDAQTKTENLSEEKKKHYQILWEFIVKKSMNDGCTENSSRGIKESDLIIWIKKYQGKEIKQALDMALKIKPNKTWAGYVTKLLTEKIPKKKEDSKDGRLFVEKFIKDNKLTHIEMKQQYFIDLKTNDQHYYNLPISTIENNLRISLERFLREEEEESIQREQEED